MFFSLSFDILHVADAKKEKKNHYEFRSISILNKTKFNRQKVARKKNVIIGL